MIREYISAAMVKAEYEDPTRDDGTFYGEIPGFQGVWANNDTLEECRTEFWKRCWRFGCSRASVFQHDLPSRGRH